MSEAAWLKEVLERNKEEIATWPSWAKEDSSRREAGTTKAAPSASSGTLGPQQTELELEQKP